MWHNQIWLCQLCVHLFFLSSSHTPLLLPLPSLFKKHKLFFYILKLTKPSYLGWYVDNKWVPNYNIFTTYAYDTDTNESLGRPGGRNKWRQVRTIGDTCTHTKHNHKWTCTHKQVVVHACTRAAQAWTNMHTQTTRCRHKQWCTGMKGGGMQGWCDKQRQWRRQAHTPSPIPLPHGMHCFPEVAGRVGEYQCRPIWHHACLSPTIIFWCI